ncbi:hypothetical protein D018_3436B, partial [Vibrio parahaemolyticus VP2007-007]
LKDKQCEYNKT